MRKPVTDTALEAEREKNRFKRGERTGNHLNYIFVTVCWMLALGGIIFYAYCAIVYCAWLGGVTNIDDKKISIIAAIYTHTLAGIGGYIFHLIKKNLD